MNLNKHALSEETALLLQRQKKDWPLVRENYEGLKQTESKCFSFGEFRVIVQFNPGRMRSSTAKTDEESIRNRACFLCTANRPAEQEGLEFNSRFTVLVNPYPIFPSHLTVPLNEHLPQRIEPYFKDMLGLSRQLPEFTVFYNGPECGASAPDHFHFQAVTKNVMPIDTEADIVAPKIGELIFRDELTTIHACGKEYLRKFISISSSSEKELEHHFGSIVNILKERGQKGEPMMNVICSYITGKWTVIIFPRDKQRPWQFFADDNSKILVSPGTVEFGGLCVVPRKEDFDKITKHDLVDIYNQVTINDEDFNQLKKFPYSGIKT